MEQCPVSENHSLDATPGTTLNPFFKKGEPMAKPKIYGINKPTPKTNNRIKNPYKKGRTRRNG